MAIKRKKTSRYKLKNVVTIIGIIVLLPILTVIQMYIYKLKGIPILFHALANLNVILILIVVIIQVRYLIRLYFERPGSRFRQKLVLACVLSAFIPSTLLVLLSTNFIRETFEKWLNPIHGEPLENAMSVVRILHNHYQERGVWFGNQLAQRIIGDNLLAPEKKEALNTLIRQKQQEYNLGVIQVFDQHGVELYRTVNENIPVGSIVTTPSENIEAALRGETSPPLLVTAGGGTLYQNFIPLVSTKETIVGVLVVNFFSTERLQPKLESITRSSITFQQQLMMKEPLKREYMFLFIIPTLLILFFTTWFGFYLAKGVTLPIQMLAEGTQAIAAGNLDYELDITAYDEVGTLVDAFKKMQLELKSSTAIMDAQNRELHLVNRELDRKQHYMLSMLKSFTSGVVAMDSQGLIITVNPAAQTMLQVEPQFMIGRSYQDVLTEEGLQQIKKMIGKCFHTGIPILNKEIHFFSKRMTLHLSASTTIMKEPEGELLGVALVIEDLTELIKVQKAAAWSEVARRIAHEIKNPLTPIRLSAQRIKRKYQQDGALDEVLNDCCSTIVREVDTIQRLVDSFSRFAKMPEAKPIPVKIDQFIENLLDGFNHIHPEITIIKNFESGLPQVNLDPNLMKQALFNIIDNSVEAMNNRGTLQFDTRFDSFLNIIRLEICDDGPGIKEEDKEKLFLPYFSTKKRGTGLGLAIVARIIAEHYGYIRITDNFPHGTRFVIELPAMSRPYPNKSEV
ncbi:PAS domain-containing protein [bacterium]|nr:PAS domain-containing protein [bacterium]